MDLVPAHNAEAERSVASAVICYGAEAVGELHGWFDPADCYLREERLVLQSAWKLFAADETIDLVTLAGQLRKDSRLEEIGGSSALAAMPQAVPTLRNYIEHARNVVTLARIRAVAAVCLRIEAESHGDVGTPSEWLSGAETRIYEAARVDDYQRTTVTIGEVVDSEADAANSAARSPEVDGTDALGVKSGIIDLDRALGCLKFGYKYALGAFPGGGKTGLAIQIACNVASSGHGVAFASQEMGRRELVQRAISIESRIDNRKCERYTFDGREWDLVAAAWKRLRGLPIRIDDRSQFSVASLRAWLRRTASQLEAAGTPMRLVVVDHLHLLATKSGRKDEQDVAELSNGTREIAKDFGVALLELHPFNRATHDQKRPTLRSFKGSSAVEHDAYGVIALHRDDLQQMDRSQHDGKAELLLLKVRGGGQTGKVDLQFTDWCTRFDAFEPEEPEWSGGYGDFNDSLA